MIVKLGESDFKAVMRVMVAGRQSASVHDRKRAVARSSLRNREPHPILDFFDQFRGCRVAGAPGIALFQGWTKSLEVIGSFILFDQIAALFIEPR
jgi:hypothetical protein